MIFSPHRTLRPLTAVVAGASVVAVTACSAPDEQAGSKDDTIKIVASTSIWADVAEAVADSAQGVEVEVDPIVEGNGVDPHHFEPTAADVAKANEADILLVNGGGYDNWIYQAVSNQDHIISALPLVDHGKLDEESDVVTAVEAKDIAKQDPQRITNIEGNEHIWYDAAAMEKVGKEIADTINAEHPDAGASEDELVKKVEGLRDRVKGMPELDYAQTEPIADYLLKYTPAHDATPEGYRKTTVSEGEPSAADLARFLETIKRDEVDLLIYNPQTETDLTARIRDAAADADVQIVEIGETPPEDKDFFEYYEQVVGDLENAEASA